MNRKWVPYILITLIAGGFVYFLSDPGSKAAGSLSDTGITMGKPDAPIRIVEFTNFGCSFCKQQHEQIGDLLKEKISEGEVYYTLKHVDLEPYPNAAYLYERLNKEKTDEALNAEIDQIFSKQKEWENQTKSESPAVLKGIVGFSKSPVNQKDVPLISKEAKSVQIKSVPSLFINGKNHEGVLTKERLENALNSK